MKKQLGGYEQAEGIALLVTDTGRRQFSAPIHPQLTIGTTATAFVELIRVAAGSLTTAQRTTLGMSAAADLPTTIIAKRGFLFKAMPANTGTIYFGGSEVAATGAICGWPMAAGDSLFLELTDSDDFYFDATASGQLFSWLAI